MQTLKAPNDSVIYYKGIGPEGGILPAFFYFSLSGEESLELSPYNQPVVDLEGTPMRIFSFTIPGHGHGFDKFKAMQYWAKTIEAGDYLLEEWLKETADAINWLVDSHLVDKDRAALGGLSRGGWVATQLAARLPFIKTLVGFAPVTCFSELEDFKPLLSDTRVRMRLEELKADRLCEHLTHLHNIRFYIGVRDVQVSTDACYHFIRSLAEKAHEKNARGCKIELRLSPSIGHKGHGTPPHIFREGAEFIKQAILRD